MKESANRPNNGLFSFPFLALVYALVAAASYLVAARSFGGVFSSALFSSPEGLFFLVAAPLGLLILIGFLFFGAVSDSLQTEGSSPLRLNVFLSFCLLLVSVAVPESVIVGKFASAALGSWFDRSIPETMNVAAEMADLYMEERINDIHSVSDKYLSGLAISTWRTRPADWMTGIRSVDRYAVACQVYQEKEENGVMVRTPVMESGDSLAFVAKDRLEEVKTGLFEITEGEPYLRWGEKVRYGNNVYLCAYTTAIPDTYYAKLDSVRSARERARVIDTLKPFFPFLGIWIFAMFLLPALGMTLILAWRYSCRLSSRVRSHSSVLASLAAGGTDMRLVTAAKDELAEAAQQVNELAERLGGGKEISCGADRKSFPAGDSGESVPKDPKRATLKLKKHNGKADS